MVRFTQLNLAQARYPDWGNDTHSMDVIPHTPVVMLTGWGRRMSEDGERPPHVDHLISKPPRASDLRAVLARCANAA